MNEERVQRLEEGLTAVLIENAKLASALQHLSGSVMKLDATVQDLRDTMNKGRGALWAFGLGSVCLGAAISTLVNRALLWSKPSSGSRALNRARYLSGESGTSAVHATRSSRWNNWRLLRLF